jgi:hypothetical protein
MLMNPIIRGGDKDKAAGREVGVVALLKLFDLAENTTAEDVLLSVQAEIFNGLELDGECSPFILSV